jgi:DNA-binding transcriptional regulator PaaX
MRGVLRFKLESIGFIRLQNSVWVYPYDCEELLVLLKNDYQLGKEVLYIIADKIERSTVLKRRFGL